jgi:putative phage-type endonuclease
VAELIPTSTEAEWLEARRKGVTASEIAVIMGLSPWSSPYALYHQKLGILPPQEDNAAMERGRVLEPYIARKFAELHPEFLVEGDGRSLFAHAKRAWQLATPDRFVCETEWHDRCNCGVGNTGYYGMHERDCGLEIGPTVAVAEFKTASDMSEWGEPGTDEIPVHYRAQVLWQMDVMGVSRAYVAVLDIPRWEVREYVIEHEDEQTHDELGYLGCPVCVDQHMMREAALEFLGRIERQEPPDVDWRPATAYALKQLHPSVEEIDAVIPRRLAVNYRAASRNFKHWEERKKLYEARIREAIGPAHRALTVDGQVIARRDVYEVSESVRRAYTVDKLVPVKPKKES